MDKELKERLDKIELKLNELVENFNYHIRLNGHGL